MRSAECRTEAFTNPNGIAVDESTGDVYVADIGTDTVYKFDANGNPVNFTSAALHGHPGTISWHAGRIVLVPARCTAPRPRSRSTTRSKSLTGARKTPPPATCT